MGPKRQQGGNNGNSNANANANPNPSNNKSRQRGKGGGGGGKGKGGTNGNAGGMTSNSGSAAGVSARPPRARVESECSPDDACPVCLNKMKIFAVGLCNHHVCSECSTRMRVLCQQNECPICRQDMPKVIHTISRHSYADVADNPYKIERRFRICFENDFVEKSFHELLEHLCQLCHADNLDPDRDPDKPPKEVLYKSFKSLEQHVKRIHELFFCDLCVTNLKIFTHERRVYTRSQLATHRRKGDPDDTSHRGHPLCEFCDTRFVDKDVLFQHLRRDHFFCHFCDVDGIQNFYPDYDALREHFSADHFLCLEGPCENEQFTHAFRTDIDLKAHRAERHAGGLSKSEAKQNRTISGLDFNYSRPTAAGQASRRRGLEADLTPMPASSSSRNESSSIQIVEPSDRHRTGQEQQPQNKEPAPEYSADNFPSLGGGASSGGASRAGSAGPSSLATKLASSTGRNTSSQQWSDGRRVPQAEDFPSLPGANFAAAPAPVSGSYTNGAMRKKLGNQGGNKPKTKEEEFPSLGGPSKGFPASFAARSSMARVNSAPIYKAPSWQQQQQGERTGKSHKVAPAPNFDDPFDVPVGETKSRPQSASNANSAEAYPPLATMTQLTKKAPTANSSAINHKVKISSEEDFPGLGPQTTSDATVSKKNKKKKNKNRFAEDEEPRSDFLRDLDSSAKSSSSLLSAADLIFGADIAVPSASSAGAAMMNNSSIRIEKSHDRENVEPNSGDDSSGSSWSKVEAREQKNAAGISKKMEAKGNGAIPGLKFEPEKKPSPAPSAPPPGWGSATAKKNPPTQQRQQPVEDYPSLGPSSKPSLSANFKSFSSVSSKVKPSPSAARIMSQMKPRSSVTPTPTSSRVSSSSSGSSSAAILGSMAPDDLVASTSVMASNVSLVTSIDALTMGSSSASKPTTTNKKTSVKAPSRDDFPSLGPSSKKIPANFRSKASSSGIGGWAGAISSSSSSNGGGESERKKTAPPPGFTGKAPPGFSAPAPKKKLHRAEYIQPPEFKARNGKLVETISNLVGGGKSDKFDQFKKISSSFRSGQISCEDYHRNCLELVGQKKFFEFFPELVYLLPDIKKQQDLKTAHVIRFPHSKVALPNCGTCDQILSPGDLDKHEADHEMDQEFPQLG